MSKKILTLIALSATMHALAQQDSSKATNLDEVVVTATKFPIKTSATGKVITVITKQQLEQSGGKDLSQILNEQVGLQINGANSNSGKDKSIYLRGADARYTLITIDGVPVYDASGVYGNFDIRNINIDLVERVEILKGSQSTLYGSDAIAGVINIITKKSASNKVIEGAATVSYGTYNNIKGNAGLQGKANNIDYSVGYTYNKTNGFSEAVTNNANADKDGYKQEAFSANFSIPATKKITVKPFLRYGWLKGDIDNGAFTDGLNNTYTQKSFNTGVKNEIVWGKTVWNVLYSFNKIDRAYNEDSRKGENGYAYYTNSGYKGTEHFAEIYTQYNLCKTLQLTAGADYRNSKTSQNYNYWDAFFPFSSSYSGDSAKQNQLGVYAAFNYHNNLGFNVEFGGRWNKHNVYGSNSVFNINPSYQVTDDIKVFANISSGYRTPALDQLYNSFYGNKNLKPEVSTNVELGLQHYFDNKNIKTQVVLFSRKITDVQLYNAGKYINRDKQNDFGFEFETAIKASANTTIKIFYTFLDGYTTTKAANGKDTSLNNLLRKPKHSLGFNLSTKITDRLFASANVQWFAKRNDAYFDNYTYQTVNTILDNYALVDVYAEYVLLKNKLRIFANARNITNTTYTEIAGYNTMGINIYGGVRFNF